MYVLLSLFIIEIVVLTGTIVTWQAEDAGINMCTFKPYTCTLICNGEKNQLLDV